MKGKSTEGKFWAGQANAGAHAMVTGVTLSGVIVEDRMDDNPLTFEDVDDDVGVSTGSVDTIKFGL